MTNKTLDALLGMIPITQIKETVHKHIQPLVNKLPEKRMASVIEIMILGIQGGQTPVITGIARQNSKEEGEIWSIAMRIYRLLDNKRLKTGEIYDGLYTIGEQVIEREYPEYLMVGVDPVNLEKTYSVAIEGMSMVHKTTLPNIYLGVLGWQKAILLSQPLF